MAEVRTFSVVDGTRVYLDARSVVVRQQFVVVGTRALDASLCVCAEVRTSSVIQYALVDVLASLVVMRESVSQRTPATRDTVRPADTFVGAIARIDPLASHVVRR